MAQQSKAKTVPTTASAPEQSTGLTHEDLNVLRAPFTKDRLGVKVQSFSKDRTRAMLVLYLQHTDVQDRLEQVDPSWSTEVLTEERQGDSVYVRLRMTVKGVSRENVGEGGDPKAAYSDALKRCAMLFGVGRYLYDSVTVWTEYNDQRDRFRNWSIEDYERASRGQANVPYAEPEAPGLRTSTAVGKKSAVAAGGAARAPSRDQLNRTLMNLYRPYLSKFPETRFVELLQGRYNVGETRLMTVEQLQDLISYMEQQLQSVA